jgi:hypothetical protein
MCRLMSCSKLHMCVQLLLLTSKTHLCKKIWDVRRDFFLVMGISTSALSLGTYSGKNCSLFKSCSVPIKMLDMLHWHMPLKVMTGTCSCVCNLYCGIRVLQNLAKLLILEIL